LICRRSKIKIESEKMNLLTAAAIPFFVLACTVVHGAEPSGATGSNSDPAASNDSQKIVITRKGSQPSSVGPAEYFTGTVRINPLFRANDPARAAGASVAFEPGAHSAWHTHPLGQTLIVTAGTGLVQRWGGPVETIRPGDVVWIPPGQTHWHGAAPKTAMTHIAIQEHLNGKVVDWLEKVSDEQYQARPKPSSSAK
jgi:quercetin dioxygenase-like cupin family protein